MKLSLAIVTPLGVYLEAEADEVYLMTSRGPIGILPRHSEILGALSPYGALRLKNNGTTRYFYLGSGAYRLEKGRLKVLTNDCKENSDKEQTRAMLKEHGVNLLV